MKLIIDKSVVFVLVNSYQRLKRDMKKFAIMCLARNEKYLIVGSRDWTVLRKWLHIINVGLNNSTIKVNLKG